MSLSDYQSDNLSPTVIQYPYIQLANKQETNAPPPSLSLPPTRPIAAAESACVTVLQGETNAEAPTDNENDNDNFQISVRCLVPTRGTPYQFNFFYDKFYFPAELCADWNILHGASVPSFAFTAHSRATGETMENEHISEVFKRFNFPPRADFSLLSFLQQHPTRAMAYIQFLAPLQENYSQRIESLASAATKWGTCMVLLLMFGFAMLVSGLVFLIAVTVSCNTKQNDEQKSSQNSSEQTGSACSTNVGLILAGVVFLVFGLVLLLCGAVLARKLKRLFAEELEKKSCALTLCGHGASESSNSQTLRVPRSNQQPQLLQLQKELGLEQQYQQLQQQLQQRESAWHAEVRFEAGSETFSVVACFTISWKTCNEQCAQHRSSCPLVQVVVDHNGSAHTQSQSQSQS